MLCSTFALSYSYTNWLLSGIHVTYLLRFPISDELHFSADIGDRRGSEFIHNYFTPSLKQHLYIVMARQHLLESTTNKEIGMGVV